MGNICAEKVQNLPEDPTPDPDSGLTQKEKRLLKELWLVLTENSTLKEEGVKFSVKLYQQFPAMIEYYPEQLCKDTHGSGRHLALRVHGIAVMFGMTAYIECLDETNTIVSLIEKLATSHDNYGITAEVMKKLLEVFYEFIQEECRHAVDQESFVALKKLLVFHNKVYERMFHTNVPHNVNRDN